MFFLYLHQLSYHKELLKACHFSQGRSSTLRPLLNHQSPGCAYRNDQDLKRNNQVSLDTKGEKESIEFYLIFPKLNLKAVKQ